MNTCTNNTSIYLDYSIVASKIYIAPNKLYGEMLVSVSRCGVDCIVCFHFVSTRPHRTINKLVVVCIHFVMLTDKYRVILRLPESSEYRDYWYSAGCIGIWCNDIKHVISPGLGGFSWLTKKTILYQCASRCITAAKWKQ